MITSGGFQTPGALGSPPGVMGTWSPCTSASPPRGGTVAQQCPHHPMTDPNLEFQAPPRAAEPKSVLRKSCLLMHPENEAGTYLVPPRYMWCFLDAPPPHTHTPLNLRGRTLQHRRVDLSLGSSPRTGRWWPRILLDQCQGCVPSQMEPQAGRGDTASCPELGQLPWRPVSVGDAPRPLPPGNHEASAPPPLARSPSPSDPLLLGTAGLPLLIVL